MIVLIRELLELELLATTHHDSHTAGRARYLRYLLEDHAVPSWAARALLDEVETSREELLERLELEKQLDLFPSSVVTQ
jgi:hypothetical protein